MLKATFHSEDITVMNIYAPNYIQSIKRENTEDAREKIEIPCLEPLTYHSQPADEE